MNTPKVQTDADQPPRNPKADPQPRQVDGVPDADPEGKPKASPSSDRQKTENVPVRSEP